MNRPERLRLLLAGASGSIGGALAQALAARGHQPVCLLRRPQPVPAGVEARVGDLADACWLREQGLAGPRFDAVFSCIASRSGVPADAWAVDHGLNHRLLAAAREADIGHFVMLSALCVQKPRLAFQQAKLAFEQELISSGLRYSIVRPTAFFKSLSGQVERVRRGAPYLLLGDGRLTACKPIADADLAAFLADCLHEPTRWNQRLPIGGPGPAITPREQGELLFRLLGRPARFRSLPAGLLGGVAGALGLGARLLPGLAAKAELAKIGRYYASESMLVWDGQRYRDDLTPSTGSLTLEQHYRRLLAGELQHELGEQAVF